MDELLLLALCYLSKDVIVAANIFLLATKYWKIAENTELQQLRRKLFERINAFDIYLACFRSTK